MSRIVSFDIFRGFLVINMILFHILVNFLLKDSSLNYFNWVSGGFILFLGIIISQFLFDKPKKMFLLASKLLLIYLLVNFRLIFSIFSDVSNFQNYYNLLSANQSVVSFEILFDMFLTLILAIFISILKFDFGSNYTKLILILSFCSLIFLEFFTVYNYTLIFLNIGIFGIFLGKAINLDNFATRIQKSNNYLILLFLVISISVFQFIYESNLWFLVVLQSIFLYFLCFILAKTKLSNFLIFLGKNSLNIYILHIILIKLILFWL